MNKTELPKELAIAIKAATEAGKALRKHFQNINIIKFRVKNEYDLLSVADEEAEKIIIEILVNEFPHYAYFSEEKGYSQHSDEKMWVIDPLDGTNNFAVGIANFSISISLLNKGICELGVIYRPVTDELFFAQKSNRAFLNFERILIVKDKSPTNIISVVAGLPSAQLQNILYYELSRTYKRVMINWSPAYDFSMLAAGKIDAIISLKAESEDKYAGMLIAEEAGCVIKYIDDNLNIIDKPFQQGEFNESTIPALLAKDERIMDKLMTEIKIIQAKL